MSGERVLLDSVIVIDHLNGIDVATRYLAQVASRAALSPITRAEVLSGYASEHAPPVRALLDRFTALVIDDRVADEAARLRQRYRWRLPDALQAALAVIHGMRLATRDTRDFSPRRHRFVTVPYRLRADKG